MTEGARVAAVDDVERAEPLKCRRLCVLDQYGLMHEDCVRKAEHDLADLPELYVTLSVLLAPATSSTSGRVTGTHSKPIGIRPDVFDTMRAFVDVLASWTAQVIEVHPGRLVGDRRLPLRRPRRMVVGPAGTVAVDHLADRDRDAARVRSTTRWLTARAPWLWEQSWSADFGEEIRDLAHSARKLARLYDEEPDLKLGVPCSRCEWFTLARYPGEVDVHCVRIVCQRVYRPEEYRKWVEAYAADPAEALADFELAAKLRETAAELEGQDRRLRRHASGLRREAKRLETPMTEQAAPTGLARYDDLPPAAAVAAAWSEPGASTEWHGRGKAVVTSTMPLLARALDRLAEDPPTRPSVTTIALALDALDDASIFFVGDQAMADDWIRRAVERLAAAGLLVRGAEAPPE
jgi:hypothetical protein